MARGFSPYYAADQQLGASIGSSLATALFGDPAMRQKLQEHQAEMELRGAQTEQARAHAGLFGEQTRGVRTSNDAVDSLPALIASMFTPQAAPVDDLAPLPEEGAGYYPSVGSTGEAVAAGFDPATFQAGLPALMAAFAQAKGDKVDPNAIIGGLAAMMGNDEFARRGMIAQGHTPSDDFALTTDRADAISARDAAESKDEKLSVERIQSSDRRYSTDVGATTARRGQDIRSSDTRRGQDIASDDRNAKLDASGYDRGGAIALGNTLGTVTSTVRSEQHNKDVGGVGNSYHLASRGGRGIDVARRKGVTHAQVVQAYRNAGYTILEQLDEGDHSHLALAGGPNPTGGKGGGKGSKSLVPKTVNAATAKTIDKEIEAQLAARRWNAEGKALSDIRISAQKNYQRGGSPAEAVSSALEVVAARMKGGAAPAKAAAAKPAGKPSANDLQRQALAAIGKGADPAQVKARYKKMTGQDLKGV